MNTRARSIPLPTIPTKSFHTSLENIGPLVFDALILYRSDSSDLSSIASFSSKVFPFISSSSSVSSSSSFASPSSLLFFLLSSFLFWATPDFNMRGSPYLRLCASFCQAWPSKPSSFPFPSFFSANACVGFFASERATKVRELVIYHGVASKLSNNINV